MDLSALRDAAIEATARALYDKHGEVPSEESDEWEAEYRRQFALLKQQHGGEAAVVARPVTALPGERPTPELAGTLEEQRWGATIRSERFADVPSAAIRNFMMQTWPRAKQWIDTRDVPTPVLLQRLKPRYEEWRKKQAEAAQSRAAAVQQKAAAVAAHQEKLAKAGITPEGLVDMIDASDRFDLAPIAGKLAEIDVGHRNLRVFETADPNLLLVKEKNGRGPEDYAIERDEGLAADLKLFGQAP